MNKKNPKTIKKTAYIVVESESGCDCPSYASGGFPTIYFTLNEAKRKLKTIVTEWDDEDLSIGVNDGDKWADYRYDSNGLLAWVESGDYFKKVEIFTREIEIPIAPELNELAKKYAA